MQPTSRLGLALRKRFKTPGDCLRSLGIPAATLAMDAEGEGGLRAALEAALKSKLSGTDLAEVMAIVDRHAGEAGRDEGVDDPVRAITGNHVAKDGDPAAARALMKAGGLTDADVEHVFELASGKDRRPAMDAAMRAANEAEVDRIYGTNRIHVEAAAGRPRPAAPSDGATRDFDLMYPDASRLGWV